MTGHSSLNGIFIILRLRTPRCTAKKQSGKGKRSVPKTVLRLPDLDQAKSAVLNSLSSIDAQRGYRHAIDEFIEWYCSEPRLFFSKIVVLRYRIQLKSRLLAPGTINLRLGAPPRLRGFRLRSAKPRPGRRHTTREGGHDDRGPIRGLADARTIRAALA
jgi:hypothetical protein